MPALTGWIERRSSPYAERDERDDNRVDRILLAGHEVVSARLPFRRQWLRRFADRVIAQSAALERLTEEALLAEAAALRPQLLRHGFQRDLVERAFAVVREACGRALGKRHYPVQLMGGAAMLEGWLAEMATGEGKTLTAALPACVAALAGMPVHVVTVNDYLSERDAGILAPAYAMLGLTVGVSIPNQPPADRRAAHAADITHTSNNELVFDYLKDRLTLGRAVSRAGHAIGHVRHGGSPPLLLRGLGLAVVDEADSVLVDEARTPLIISAEVDQDDSDLCSIALALARELDHRHYVLRDAGRHVSLTDRGRSHVAELAPDEGLWRVARAREELVEQGLSAIHLFRRDEHYVVAGGEVQIVDEFTGRIAEGRTWEKGLHQMIETKEGLATTKQRDARAKLTYQRFFRRYLRLCGMSGTAKELAGELRAVYALPVVTIPTHRPSQRITLPARMLPDEWHKWRAVAEAAVAMAAAGRPVLIGTRSVAASEALGQVLTEAGVAHTILNARHDKTEAEIVARAGEAGRITVATNMAGRGTDIQLPPDVEAAGGLHVILTEFHESARIDRQLIGRGARQGNPGSWQAIVARDDDLFRRFAPAWMRQTAKLITLRRWCQAAAERTNAASRSAAQREESGLRDRLAFTGQPD
jgi:preprotein translocase subunit SecA